MAGGGMTSSMRSSMASMAGIEHGELSRAYRRSSCPKDEEVDVGASYAHIEISAVSEHKKSEIALILSERNIANHPIKSYVKSATQQILGRRDLAPSKLKERPGAGGNLFLRMLYSSLPVLTWMPKINLMTFRADIVAGLTVGVMTVPQGISYGALAGLPYTHGLYSACVPTIVYALFGQSRQLAVGPVSLLSLMVQAGLQGQLTKEDCPAWYAPGGSSKLQSELCGPQYVNLACLTAAIMGLMQITGAVLRLGFLVSFLGHPVTSGFTSGAAIITGVSQLKDIFGYDIAQSQYVHVMLASLFGKIGKAQPLTVFLSLGVFAYLLLNKFLARRFRRLRFLQPLGPLLSCVAGSLLLLAVPSLVEDFHIKYIGAIPKGLMPVSITHFRVDDVQKVLPTALSVVLIGYMESIAIGKSLAAHHGYEIDAGQEMLALGLANFLGSTLSCFPVTGSFSRSAMANATGAQTQLAGFITGVMMFCTLMFLTPLFYYLPKFVLAAIVVNGVLPLIAIEEARSLWRVKRHDFVLWVVAFLGTLFLGVLVGILVAVSLSMVIIIYESVRPQITILWRIPGTTIYRNVKQDFNGAFVPNVLITRIGSSLYFANVSFVKDMLLTYVGDIEDVNPTEYLVLDMTPVITLDSTACHVLQDIVAYFRSKGIKVAFATLGNRVEKTLRNANLMEFIGERWFFATVDEAVQFCVRHQHAKNRLACRGSAQQEDRAADATWHAQDVAIGCTDEFGFSNTMHSDSTMLFITMSEDVCLIMGAITAIFRRCQLCIVRAHIEPTDCAGVKHVYFLRTVKSGGKLSEFEIEILRRELKALLNGTQRSKSRGAASGGADMRFGAAGACDVSHLTSAKTSVADVGAEAAILEVPQQKFAALQTQVREILAILRDRGVRDKSVSKIQSL